MQLLLRLRYEGQHFEAVLAVGYRIKG